MADLLRKHLEEKAKEHSGLSLLFNQWCFDEKLIPKALQTIGSLFPHYSRHDESHSKQILVNIERLLGPSLSKLSATDTWLILEAAYWHDIGMVVPSEDIEAIFQDPDFKEYVKGISSDPAHELCEFARCFETSKLTTCFTGAASPLDAVEKFRYLIAEWFRRKHSVRANEIVLDPWARAGISSPRTELIPARLFRLLGRVCQMHGADFESLTAADGLAFKESGLANEDCHPRFVACLLRLGDLLDLDDNRFCPVMQRIAGDSRPRLSKAHEAKHAAIRHFRLDRERIEVHAECETIESYLESFKWFDWLKLELQNQMATWDLIAPSRDLGLLPTLGEVKVRLDGEFQILQEGQRPQFTVDGAKVFDLLKGTNIYADPYVCVRELLQNAVDSTLIAAWLSKRRLHGTEYWDSPESASSAFSDRAIKVELEEMPRAASDDSSKTRWLLKVSDNGTGVSYSDLSYMLRVGASQRNRKRQQYINEMPQWMRPSGAFGIGLQSIFLLSEKVSFKSKNIFDSACVDVEMHSPTGDKEGLVLVKSTPNDLDRAYGAVFEMEFYLDRFPKKWTVSLDRKKSIAMQFMEDLDPVLDASFPWEAGQIADKIVQFASSSFIDVHATIKTSKNTLDFLDGSQGLGWVKRDQHFIHTQYGDLGLAYVPIRGVSTPEYNLFFRGQSFSCKRFKIPHVYLEVNLLSGGALSWLSANRDELAVGAQDELEKLILAALEIQVRQDIHANSDVVTINPILYSLFLQVMRLLYDGAWVGFSRDRDDWKRLEVGGGKVLADYFAQESFIVVIGERTPTSHVIGESIFFNEYSDQYLFAVVIDFWTKRMGRFVSIVASEETGANELYDLGDDGIVSKDYQDYLLRNSSRSPRYKFTSKKAEGFTPKALANRLLMASDENSTNRRFLVGVSGVLSDWAALALRADCEMKASNIFIVSPEGEKFLLLPYLYKSSVSSMAKTNVVFDARDARELKRLCTYVHENLEVSMDIEKVEELYLSLVEFIDKKLMAECGFLKEWEELRK